MAVALGNSEKESDIRELKTRINQLIKGTRPGNKSTETIQTAEHM